MDGGEINRDVEVLQGFAVADRAVGDDALGAPDLGAEREDVADGSRGRVAARLDDQDLAGPDLLDGLLLGVHPAAAQCPSVLGEQVLAERHVPQRPGESGHLRGRPGGVQPVQGDGVVAALAQLRGERGGRDGADGREQLGGGVGGTGRAPGTVRQLPLRVVGVRHRAGRAEGVVGLFDRAAQPAGGLLAIADLDFHQVAGPHHGGARRGAGEDDVAGLERSQPGNIRHDVGESKKQVVAGDRRPAPARR